MNGGSTLTRECVERRESIQRELRALNSDGDTSENLDKLAEFLNNVASAYNPATQEQRNRLARCLFE
jgi:hypothetical protein